MPAPLIVAALALGGVGLVALLRQALTPNQRKNFSEDYIERAWLAAARRGVPLL
jgi:hypothetical protein